MERDEEANIRIDQLMNSDEYAQRTRQFDDYMYLVYCTCNGMSTIDDEEEDEGHVRYSSRDDILTGHKDILRTIPRDNMKKSMEHLIILDSCGLTLVLVSLYRSKVQENKEIAKECIRLFLIDPKTKSGFLPRSIQKQCVTIVLSICGLLGGISDTGDDEHQQLYNSCRETLVYILKSIAFSKRARYFGIARTSQLIEILYDFISELHKKLVDCLESTYMSSSPLAIRDLRSLETDFQEYAFISLHLCRAIEDHVRVKGRSLPFHLNDFEEGSPYYLSQIDLFHDLFLSLVMIVEQCLDYLNGALRDAGGDLKYNNGWSYLLNIMKELNNISKIYADGKEVLSAVLQGFPLQINYLIRHSNRGEDHLWLFEHDNAIDLEARRNLLVIMFPEVKDENQKLHKMLIDRSLLLRQSVEHIAHFKEEIAKGYGVLREWLLLVCQALFTPENSLFVECPEDRRRFFPNPAKVKPQELKLFGFCGRVIALALMHKVQVGIAFDRIFFLQLATKKISLEDIRCADPVMYRSCKKILEMDADFVDSDAMDLTFVWENEEFGFRKIVELCPGGNNIVVNSKNRKHYVDLLIHHFFVKSISTKVACFARGFSDILCKQWQAKRFFQGIELNNLDHALLGSCEPLCIKDWKAHTVYEGYKAADDQILWFWKVVEGMSMEQQRELLFFWTSVKYLPVNGFSGLPYPLTIYKTTSSNDHLPSSHTCFCRLGFPHYPSLAITQQHLSFICQQHIGRSFGFA
ncbi:hypothetical protein MKX03_023273 [Papaver bracteatum]|nr:hypothetical protein MKX03_023273 [Papaver bracteatum]